jgi:hypothetical protein
LLATFWTGFGLFIIRHKILCRSEWRIPFWPSDEKVKQCADEMQKHDRQHPADFFAIGQAFVLDGVNEHPNPENKHQQTDDG